MGFRFSLQISHLLALSLPSPVSLQGEVQPSGLGLLFGWLDLVLIFGLHPTDVQGYSCICTRIIPDKA